MNEASTTVSEPEGGFSYTVPAGWSVMAFPGIQFRLVVGPASSGFAPNINFVVEGFTGSVEDYAVAGLQGLQAAIDDVKVADSSDFDTDSGLQGFRAVTESTQQGRALRQVFFFLPGQPGKKFVVTCSALAQDGAQHDALFDRIMRSFSVKS